MAKRGGKSSSNGKDSKGSKSRGAAPKAKRKAPESDLLLEIDSIDDHDLLEFENSSEMKATIKVIGVGGGGGNALNTMIDSGLSGVDFIAANTDAQALQHNKASIRMQLGPQMTRGLGCGANPEKGRDAALEDRDRLHDMLTGADMVFITAGLGGGTGTGAAPVIAEVAREVGALTVAVVTKPFAFEGKYRTKHADRGLDQLHNVVDTLITIPNQRLISLAGKTAGITDAFRLADEVCLNAVRGISDLITIHGLINLDFADVRTIMNEMGNALMGTGSATGETRAADAARAAISSPLLEDLSIDGARGILINITGGSDMSLFEVNEASMLIQEAAHEDANIIFGAVLDENVPEGELRVTVIATGLEDGRPRRKRDEDFNGQTDTRPPMPMHTDSMQVAPAPMAQGRQNQAQAEPDMTGTPENIDPSADQSSWLSPFEDELDVPTFLRKKGDDDDETEVPAFLRRSAD
jgi:cell division protein FtsZ